MARVIPFPETEKKANILEISDVLQTEGYFPLYEAAKAILKNPEHKKLTVDLIGQLQTAIDLAEGN